MAEGCVSIAAKLAEYLVDPTFRKLQHLFNVGKITKTDEIIKEELILRQKRVRERVQEAINRIERIDGKADTWKDDMKSLIEKLENLEEELRANNGCLRGWCPTWRRYYLCKSLAKTTQRMTDQSRNRDHFNTFSHGVIVPGIEYHSSKEFMLFKSTKIAYGELWEALQNDDSSMIGLWVIGGSGKTTLFQKLEVLRIFNCPQLLHIFPADCNLGNLKYLKISNCPMLTYLFPASTACTLLSLKALKIEHCSKLTHVLEGEIGGDGWENVRFPKLKILSVNDCSKLEYVCPVFIAQRLEQLQHLSIRTAPEMKFVFGQEQLMHDQDKTQLVLPLLKYLRLENVPNLIGISSERYHTSWLSIKKKEWRDCPKMFHKKELQEFKGRHLRNEEYKPLAAIERIILYNCGVKSIFHHQIPTFKYLKEFTLEKCSRLKFVFSAYICQSLAELTSLTICCCEDLEAIFSGNEDAHKNRSIVVSCPLRLKSLQISKCNKLKFILSYSMINDATSMLPQLSTLTVSDCSQMKEIFKCSNIDDHDIGNERNITFPNIKDMRLYNLPRLVNFCQGFEFRTGEFCRVQVYCCPKLIPIMNATIDWTKERLVREYELKYNQLNSEEALNLPLSILIAGEIDIQSPRVKHKWRVIGDDEQEETNDSEILRSEQPMFGALVPAQVLSFQYLYSLEVTNIKNLKFLFSVNTIIQNSLPNLNSLTLSDCEELEVIIGCSSEDDPKYGETIMLSSLRKIELENLPNFSSVCQDFQIQMELRDIFVCNCLKFVDSSLGSALPLGTIPVSTEDSNVQTSSNVNEEKGMMLISRAESLCLEDSSNLMSVWEGPTFIMFQNLGRLGVLKCRRLKCIFSSTVIRSLPCLMFLSIAECEEMEEMMMSEEEEEEHNHFPNDESSNSLCFPKLLTLSVMRCRKLKWLFTSLPSTQCLPRLVSLLIKECSQIKGLFNSEVEIHEEGFYNNLLPNLKFLTIDDCPIFSEPALTALQSLISCCDIL